MKNFVINEKNLDLVRTYTAENVSGIVWEKLRTIFTNQVFVEQGQSLRTFGLPENAQADTSDITTGKAFDELQILTSPAYLLNASNPQDLMAEIIRIAARSLNSGDSSAKL